MDFPVLDGDTVVGVLTRDDLLQALARKQDMAVGAIMRTDIVTVEANEMLARALERRPETACRTMPVQQGGRLVGLLTMDNVGEFLAIQAARGAGQTSPRFSSNSR
jgi:CBS domain-containing protein